jgi:GalNAc-alpha-(1->4)-GalNAc-alpha-(1->3)-diNAcBac-PP-undecaprenol alpha-1,4-N-acetyl-D-galactosaminyltransferase
MSKIFLVIPTLKPGGSERVMSELANEFSEIHEVHLILLAKTEIFYKINANIIIHEFNYDISQNNFFLKSISRLKVLFSFRRLVITQKPDTLLSFIDKYNIFTICCTLFLNQKVFVSDRNNPFYKSSISMRIAKRLFYPMASGIICQTNIAKTKLQSTVRNKNVIVIPNPIKKVIVDNNVIRNKIIIHVGRFVKEKGHFDLLNIFNRIDNKNWHLQLLGDGPLRERIVSEIEILGLTKRVEILGSVEDVDSYLGKASLFLFTSYSEGFPNALAEAMASGLTCISYDCQVGPSDLIENNKNGFLIPVGDVNLFVKTINNCLKNDQIREIIGNNAKNVAIKLDRENIAKMYLKFINENSN